MEVKASRMSSVGVVRRFSYRYRITARILLLSLAYELAFPLISFGLTSGPASPDFSSFEPVATTNMVNEFSGQFVYNLPVLEVPGAGGGGYALSLSYHSGDGPESEASWVGYGWTLNPGSITRTRRGIPDDYNGKKVRYYNEVPANWTIAGTGQLGGQVASGLASASIYNTVRYNNYKGFGYTKGAGLGLLRGVFTLGYNVTDGEGTFSVAVNPAAALSYIRDKGAKKSGQEGEGSKEAAKDRKKVEVGGPGQSMVHSSVSYAGGVLGSGTTRYIGYLLSDMSSPYNLTPYEGKSHAGSFNFSADPPPAPAGFTTGIHISYTRQQNKGNREVNSYGYMYGGHAGSNDNEGGESMEDYTLEHASTFHKRDRYLPIPFNTPDAFFVSGEGLGGSFRMYNDKVGIHSPNYVESHTRSYFFGADIHLGLNNGAGGEGLINGEHTLKVQSSWYNNENGNTDDYKYVSYRQADPNHEIYEDMFFRFNNDLGGKVSYDNGGSSDRAAAAVISGKLPQLPGTLKEIQKGSSIPGNYRRSDRASYIGFHTNREMKRRARFNTNGDSIRVFAYEKNNRINTQAGREPGQNNTLDDQIGEIYVANESGNQYVYGLPVYTGGDKSMQYGIGPAGSSTHYIAHGNLNNQKKVGEEYQTPYAGTYLLTQITTPDYLDINQNGPDDLDFGGYTRMSYRREYGSDDKSSMGSWYRWRTPYTGFFRQPLRQSDQMDDMGAFQGGVKEVYYLDSIITKTHFAVFETDTRTDGYDAAADATAASSPSAQGSGRMKRLKAIRLYAKGTQGGTPQLIKTVHLEYDQSAWPGISNGASGKLTLKRVWFEYNGVVNAFISPYRFEYAYPQVNYPSVYQHIRDEMNPSPALNQAPGYTSAVDCWGNYQYDGANRRNKQQCWPSQNPGNTYDAAAWQLKRIVLPSGGELHVQYEPHSYSHVQDRPAHALVRLKPGGTNGKASVFALNLDDLGITSAADKQRLVDSINQYYGSRKMYYKFFYSLQGNSVSQPDGCNGEYIDGYVNVANAIYNPAGAGEVLVTLGGGGGVQLPWQVCEDYVKTEVGGRLFAADCGRDNSMSDPGAQNPENRLRNIAGQFIRSVMNELNLNDPCRVLNPDLSYLRVPLWRKTGGGVRVKRLMMYNKGIDAGSQGLYGTEYVYENESDGTSYGVATNEPSENRGENPLVTYMAKRGAQGWLDRLISGKDKEQFEGPLGMQAIASASIGYSRVIKRNLHQDRITGTGFTVLDYHTAKDYPYDGYYPMLGVRGVDHTDIQTIKDVWDPHIGLFKYSINTGIRSSQGYSFIQNQMHGQMKAQTSYPGSYDKDVFYNARILPAPVSQQVYRYFEPGEQVPMYNFNARSIYYDQPGKEMDVSIDRRSVVEEGEETRLTGDVTLGTVPPFVYIPYPIGFPITSGNRAVMNTISVSKMLHYPAIVKEVSVMQDGIWKRTSNVAFDPQTARPVITRTWDEYDGLRLGGSTDPHKGVYTTYEYPASSQYTAMGQKAWNERYHRTLPAGANISGSTLSGGNVEGVFTPGDLVALHYSGGVHLAHVSRSTTGTINLIMNPARSLGTSSLIAGSGIYQKIEVIRSGRTNQLAASTGGFTEYGKSNFSELDSFLRVMNTALYNMSLGGAFRYYGDLRQFSMSIKGFHTNSCTVPRVDSVSFGNHPPGPVLWGDFAKSDGSRCRLYFNHQDLKDFGGYSNYEAILAPNPNTGFSTGLVGFSINSQGNLYLNPSSITMQTDGCTGGSNFPISQIFLCYENSYQIVRAGVTTYDDALPLSLDFGGINKTGWNLYEQGEYGKWRQHRNYVYRDTTIGGVNIAGGERNHKLAGTVLFQMAGGRWINQPASDTVRWIRGDEVKKYTGNGQVLEAEDGMGILSAAKYGYRGTLPYVRGYNTTSNRVYFESFENLYPGDKGEDGLFLESVQMTDIAHTGRRGYELFPLYRDPLYIPVNARGAFTCKFWARTNGDESYMFYPSANTSSGMWYGSGEVKYKGRSGEWALYEFTTPDVQTHWIELDGEGFIDDIVIRPADGKTECYVYDVNTYRLIATLNDEHFATYYQYNGEGKLVRKLLETERGIKTVEEAQYHKPTTTK